MLSAIVAQLAAILPVKAVEGVYHILKNSQARKCFRRSVRDLTEDSITMALLAEGHSIEEAVEYNKKNKHKLKKEIEARLNASLQMLSD
jgi:hypothetical protein